MSEQTKRLDDMMFKGGTTDNGWVALCEARQLSARLDALENLQCDRTARNVDDWIDILSRRLDTLEAERASGGVDRPARYLCVECNDVVPPENVLYTLDKGVNWCKCKQCATDAPPTPTADDGMEARAADFWTREKQCSPWNYQMAIDFARSEISLLRSQASKAMDAAKEIMETGFPAHGSLVERQAAIIARHAPLSPIIDEGKLACLMNQYDHLFFQGPRHPETWGMFMKELSDFARKIAEGAAACASISQSKK